MTVKYDNDGFIKAKYYGITADECQHIIESYLEFTGFKDLIEQHPTAECNSKEQPQAAIEKKYNLFGVFKFWWNDYISDEEEDFIKEE